MMSGTVWSKFFWADWLGDRALRRCSAPARALWMDMLCLAAQGEPFGYLSDGEEALSDEEIARMTGFSVKHARKLIGELERRRVLSRDDRGRIFSRRMVRDAAEIVRVRERGAKGGNPNLIKAAAGREVNPPLNLAPNPRDNAQDNVGDKPQSPESKSQTPSPTVVARGEALGLGGEAQGSALARAARLMGVDVARLRRRPSWLIFGDMVAGLVGDGCEAERDVWPTIERIGKGMREPPASPLYFRAAILDARDQRRGRGGPHAAGLLEWEDRLAVYAAEGAWSSRWGPKPGEAGCLAPMAARAQEPAEPGDGARDGACDGAAAA
jgi:hypothetical protein